MPELTVFNGTGDDGRFVSPTGAIRQIETQVGFSRIGIRTMTGKTTIRKNWANIAIE